MDQDELQRRAHFIDTLAANVDNKKLDDASFRVFVKNSLQQFNIDGWNSKSSSTGSDYIGPGGSGVQNR